MVRKDVSEKATQQDLGYSSCGGIDPTRKGRVIAVRLGGVISGNRFCMFPIHGKSRRGEREAACVTSDVFSGNRVRNDVSLASWKIKSSTPRKLTCKTFHVNKKSARRMIHEWIHAYHCSVFRVDVSWNLAVLISLVLLRRMSLKTCCQSKRWS